MDTKMAENATARDKKSTGKKQGAYAPARHYATRLSADDGQNVVFTHDEELIFTDPDFQRLNFLTGVAAQLRHAEQWQKPAAAGTPVIISSTPPQKQLPLCT